MIFLDACILIYAVEDRGPRGARVRHALMEAPAGLAISPLVIHECLVLPFRRRDEALIEEFATMFAGCTLLDLDTEAYVHAAELRAAASGLKTVDALHLAAAQLADCSELWTNDKRLAMAVGSYAVDVIND